MAAQSLSPNEMRLILIILGLIVLALIYWFGKPGRKQQGRRHAPPKRYGHRVEPTVGDGDEGEDLGPHASDDLPRDAQESYQPVQSEFDMAAAGQELGRRTPPQRAPRPRGTQAGKRPDGLEVERIVSVMVVTRNDDQLFHGPDIVVAAEKTGLEYGHMGIFHRMLDGKPQLGPVFSAANMVKPGDFDMTAIEDLETPGLNLFMTLPGPMPALDAWDTMLPTARRIAELLDGKVVDDERNALGRQRVAYIRDDLRAWDRKHGQENGEQIDWK